jgi:DNA-binding NarL/FixJ family response regulator
VTAEAQRPPIRVLIADDHELVRDGMGRLLGPLPDIEVVALAADGEEAVQLSAGCGPDVILMDLEMPRVDGIEATRRIARAPGAPRVVVLTSFSDRQRITAALDSGAIGYMLKDAEPDELVAGIRAAADGASPLAPRVAATIVEERRQFTVTDALTERERQVLALVTGGATNREIAGELGITMKTVKAHLTQIFRHIGVADRLEAALWARRHGLRPAGR